MNIIHLVNVPCLCPVIATAEIIGINGTEPTKPDIMLMRHERGRKLIEETKSLVEYNSRWDCDPAATPTSGSEKDRYYSPRKFRRVPEDRVPLILRGRNTFPAGPSIELNCFKTAVGVAELYFNQPRRQPLRVSS